jgi:hypothetical protein
MKTAARGFWTCWTTAPSVRVDGAVGQNRPCLIIWGWKEANLQSLGKVFLLTFPLIEPTGYLPPERRHRFHTRMNIDENEGPKIQKCNSKWKSGLNCLGTRHDYLLKPGFASGSVRAPRGRLAGLTLPNGPPPRDCYLPE